MYVVKYKGPFGFIKPFSAVRDETTLSQKFLTESSIEGIKRYLECEGNIIRNKIYYDGTSSQQECIESIGGTKKSGKSKSKYVRIVLLNPILYLGFEKKEDAERAFKNIVHLSRMEDIMIPFDKEEMTNEEFDSLNGIESFKSDSEQGHFVGFNKYTKEKMYVTIKVVDA